MRAVTYLRFSSDEQADGYSLDAQRHSTHAFIDQKGWELVDDYVDEAFSARRNAMRPAFQRLLKDAHAGMFDVVVVDKVDRFYRHLKGLLSTLDELHECGVSFVSVKENLDFSTPWGKIALTILGILAEVYIDNLRQETLKGKQARARNGMWNGRVPFGYCKGNCSSCTDPNGKGYCPAYGGPDLGDGVHLIPHPVESEAVRKAFEWYATGEYSYARIAERLNDEPFVAADGTEVPFRTKGGKSSGPNPMSADSVRHILNNRFYLGQVPYYGVDENGKKRRRGNAIAWFAGKHPPLVEQETFDRVQEIKMLATRRVPDPDGASVIKTYPLSGLLVCNSCGKPMRASSTGRYRYYRDTTQIERNGACSQPTLRAEEIEGQVVGLMKQVQRCLPSDWKERLEAEWMREHAELVEEVERARERLERAKELYVDGLIVKEQLRVFQIEYQAMEPKLHPEQFSAIMLLGRTIENFDREWEAASTFTEKKRLLRLALEAAYVRGHKLVAIRPTLAFLPLLTFCQSGSDGI